MAGAGVPQSDDEDEQPFRVWCGLLGELRSLLDVPCLALTATASTSTRSAISQALGLQNAVTVVKSQDRYNILLAVKKVTPDVCCTFSSLLQLIRRRGVECPRVLVYCRTQKDFASLYLLFNRVLGEKAFCPEGQPTGETSRGDVSLQHSMPKQTGHTGVPSRSQR